MPRTPFIAGNWKMNKTVAQALDFVRELKPLLADVSGVEVAICAPFTALYALRDELTRTDNALALGAQNMFWKESGAYTGQISPVMLLDLGVEYVIVGHSEPRGRFGVPEPGAEEEFYRYFGESDHTVNLKVKAAMSHGLTPILCVGETLDERKAGRTDAVIDAQVRRDLTDISRSDALSSLVIAYEPVWAIGTGEVCGADEAQRICAVIRQIVASCFDDEVADALRIQYGGSMKPGNARELLAQPDIDGGLIGGASLIPADFAGVIRAATG